MDESEFRLTGFSQVSELTINEMKKIIKDNDSILEIGFGYGKFTKEMHNAFKTVTIYSIDNNSTINLYPQRYLDFAKIYKEISDRSTFIMTDNILNLLNIRNFDFVLIDIGYYSTDIINILKSFKLFPNIFVILPWSTNEKKIQRNIVLDYLRDRNAKWEPLQKTSTIRIFNEQ